MQLQDHSYMSQGGDDDLAKLPSWAVSLGLRAFFLENFGESAPNAEQVNVNNGAVEDTLSSLPFSVTEEDLSATLDKFAEQRSVVIQRLFDTVLSNYNLFVRSARSLRDLDHEVSFATLQTQAARKRLRAISELVTRRVYWILASTRRYIRMRDTAALLSRINEISVQYKLLKERLVDAEQSGESVLQAVHAYLALRNRALEMAESYSCMKGLCQQMDHVTMTMQNIFARSIRYCFEQGSADSVIPIGAAVGAILGAGFTFDIQGNLLRVFSECVSATSNMVRSEFLGHEDQEGLFEDIPVESYPSLWRLFMRRLCLRALLFSQIVENIVNEVRKVEDSREDGAGQIYSKSLERLQSDCCMMARRQLDQSVQVYLASNFLPVIRLPGRGGLSLWMFSSICINTQIFEHIADNFLSPCTEQEELETFVCRSLRNCSSAYIDGIVKDSVEQVFMSVEFESWTVILSDDQVLDFDSDGDDDSLRGAVGTQSSCLFHAPELCAAVRLMMLAKHGEFVAGENYMRCRRDRVRSGMLEGKSWESVFVTASSLQQLQQMDASSVDSGVSSISRADESITSSVTTFVESDTDSVGSASSNGAIAANPQCSDLRSLRSWTDALGLPCCFSASSLALVKRIASLVILSCVFPPMSKTVVSAVTGMFTHYAICCLAVLGAAGQADAGILSQVESWSHPHLFGLLHDFCTRLDSSAIPGFQQVMSGFRKTPLVKNQKIIYTWQVDANENSLMQISSGGRASGLQALAHVVRYVGSRVGDHIQQTLNASNAMFGVEVRCAICRVLSTMGSVVGHLIAMDSSVASMAAQVREIYEQSAVEALYAATTVFSGLVGGRELTSALNLSSVQWQSKGDQLDHHPYVDDIIATVRRLWESVSALTSSSWFLVIFRDCVCRHVFHSLYVQYSSIMKCSDNGRNRMYCDLTDLRVGFDELLVLDEDVSLSATPSLSRLSSMDATRTPSSLKYFVVVYEVVKVFHLDEKSFRSFIQEHPQLAWNQSIHPLIQCSSSIFNLKGPSLRKFVADAKKDADAAYRESDKAALLTVAPVLPFHHGLSL